MNDVTYAKLNPLSAQAALDLGYIVIEQVNGDFAWKTKRMHGQIQLGSVVKSCDRTDPKPNNT